MDPIPSGTQMTLPDDPLKIIAHGDTEFGPVVQLAYHAPDIDKAARYWAKTHGAGPFFLLSHIALRESFYRGAPTPFDHSSAYGQLGNLMIELIHQHNDEESALYDMFDKKSEGLHHAAVFVPDLAAAIDLAAETGFEIALDATTTEGVRFVMVDARARYGHMIELYEENEALARFYAFVRRKAGSGAGGDQDYLIAL